MHAVPHVFRPQDFVAGHVALDFSNTVTARDTTPFDWLDGYARLLEWAGKAGVLAPADSARLRSAAERAPREAAAALGRARKLREAIHDVCVALIENDEPPSGALTDLESAWKRASARAKVKTERGLLRLMPDAASSGLELPLDVIVFSAVDLLGELDRDRTRVCRGHDCGWLFVDTSKSGRRVWCDMATCGNAAKSERFAKSRRRRA